MTALRLDDRPVAAMMRRPIASASRMSGQEALARLSRLSARELDVLALLAAGQTSKLVAHNLGISAKTAEMHRARVMEKMECNSPVELGRLWEAAIVVMAPLSAAGATDD